MFILGFHVGRYHYILNACDDLLNNRVIVRKGLQDSETQWNLKENHYRGTLTCMSMEFHGFSMDFPMKIHEIMLGVPWLSVFFIQGT